MCHNILKILDNEGRTLTVFFLYTGVTLAHFRITGKVLSLIPLLIIVVKGADISSAANFRSLGGKSSQPEDFFVFRF